MGLGGFVVPGDSQFFRLWRARHNRNYGHSQIMCSGVNLENRPRLSRASVVPGGGPAPHNHDAFYRPMGKGSVVQGFRTPQPGDLCERLRGSSLAWFSRRFSDYLLRLGYNPGTTHQYLSAAQHFGRSARASEGAPTQPVNDSSPGICHRADASADDAQHQLRVARR